MLYPLIRPLLFSLPPETAHHLTLGGLKLCYKLFPERMYHAPKNVMGLPFLNPLGLAAGLDKNGEYIDALASLGFGFIEIGTITPRPQPGNPKPRLFRLPQTQALINRMGFNNLGVDYLVENVRKSKFDGILGINIGKNFDTPLERAIEDYSICLSKVYPYASYIVVNISSPNTPGLRQLQYGDMLVALFSALKKQQTGLAVDHEKYVPLVVKIAPDLEPEEISNIAQIVMQEKVDGIIATNTTIAREGLQESWPHVNEVGGLSGKPLFHKSLAVVQALNHELKGEVPMIGCGGIMSAQDAHAMFDAGASLIQVYTGLIYHGPGLVKELVAYKLP